MSDKLKPCPFCGDNNPELIAGGPGNYFVRCQQCKCTTNDVQSERATELWNTRAALAQPKNDAEAVAYRVRFRAVMKGLPSYGKDFGPWHYVETASRTGRYVDSVGYETECESLYTAPPSPERMREALEILIGSSEAFLNYFNPFQLSSDKENQWLSVHDDIGRAREALRAGDNHASDGKYDPAFVASIKEADAAEPEARLRTVEALIDHLDASNGKESLDELLAGATEASFNEIPVSPPRKIPSDDLGLPLERVRTEAKRMGFALVPNDRDAIARIIDPEAHQVTPDMYGCKSEGEMERKTVVGPMRSIARQKADKVLALRGGE